jgi:hypothetical protein
VASEQPPLGRWAQQRAGLPARAVRGCRRKDCEDLGSLVRNRNYFRDWISYFVIPYDEYAVDLLFLRGIDSFL